MSLTQYLLTLLLLVIQYTEDQQTVKISFHLPELNCLQNYLPFTVSYLVGKSVTGSVFETNIRHKFPKMMEESIYFKNRHL